MSATLYREGSDLDELLAELAVEHGGTVRVVDVDYGRDGGVLGFFAHRRVGVHYVVEAADAEVAPMSDLPHPSWPGRSDAVSSPDLSSESPLDELLRAADAAEMIKSGRAPRVPAAPTAGREQNVEFARMLLEMAGQKAAERARQTDGLSNGAPAGTGHAQAAVPHSHAVPSPTVESVPSPVAAHAAVRAEQLQALPQQVESVALPTVDTVGRSESSISTSVPRRAVGAHRADEPAGVPGALPRPGRYFDDLSACAASHPSAPRRPAPPAAAAPTSAAPPPAAPAPVAPPAAVLGAAAPASASGVDAPVVTSATPSRTSYTLRRQLAELGVPVDRIPEHDNAYMMIEQLVAQAPAPFEPDPEPGQLLVVAGPARHVVVEANRLCTRLRLDPDRLHTAGFGENPIAHRREAVALAHRTRADNSEICVVAVATDATAAEADSSGRDDLSWAASLVSALGPDHLVVVVDATSKPADARSMLAAFGRVTALAVVGAARTASPASLWDLGVGVMSLDGRPATRGAWAALLIDRLTELELV